MSEQQNFLLSELDNDGILQLTINRPDKLNALNDALLQGLAEHIQRAKYDNNIKAVLITGSGKAFCAGADINRLAAADAQAGYAFARQGQTVFREIETLGKPVLAAINGYAFGGGCELAISCHLRFASSNAQFGQPEIKLGVIPGYGGTQRLARLIGKGRALDMCLSGQNINAEQAFQYGLITELTSPEELISTAKQKLLELTKLAPIALHAILDCFDVGYDLPLPQALEFEANQFALTCATEDKNIGVSAFLEKRAAEFTGK